MYHVPKRRLIRGVTLSDPNRLANCVSLMKKCKFPMKL